MGEKDLIIKTFIRLASLVVICSVFYRPRPTEERKIPPPFLGTRTV